MDKTIRIVIDNIKKAKDKKFIDEICNNIIDSLSDWPNEARQLYFEKDKDCFAIKFKIKVCKTGDLLTAIIFEWVNLCIETEPKLFISIDEIEDNADVGVTYKLFSFVPNKEITS